MHSLFNLSLLTNLLPDWLSGGRRESVAPLAHYVVARRVFRDDDALVRALEVARPELELWKRGRTGDAEAGRRLRHLAVAITELEEVYEPEVIPQWLSSRPVGELKTPLEWLREGNLAEVLHLVNASAHGAYT